ncbi:recombination protein RecO [Campylobacter sp. FMV-PI01]|uniref:Recombination protein RecO n=1 Tax=Campylobacter portucalensis TaxID=2608384 RepID=A0A6L5WHJ1_9BACT|nr:recombination protein RecO [Campylobacter portucalensis]MSN96650.1 recombination protein RecO [Campylobacter portucalensis]
MQGYILKIQKIKDEDLIVEILTSKKLVKSYRFYGARHSKITLGYKLDFELILSNFIPRLTNTMHLGFKWLFDREKLFLWQQFIRLFHNHLKGLEDVDEIYYRILDDCAKKLDKQSPKRLFIEAYTQILYFEGRLSDRFICFACDEFIEDEEITLIRGFLLAHQSCLKRAKFKKNKIKELLETKQTINLNDDEIDQIYQILLDGF